MTLKIPAYLSANPHYYDYLHTIEFKADGRIEICDGSGQLIRTLIQGHYQAQSTEHAHAECFKLFDIAEYDPYSNEKIADLSDFTVNLIREDGIFAFKQDVVWKINNPEEHPCLLYKARYLYSLDSVDANEIKKSENFSASLDVYYANQDRQEMTLADLKKLGIDPIS